MKNILDQIPFGHENAIRRNELVRRTGLNDRAVRHLIMKSKLAGDLILNMQDGKGYFRPVLPEEEQLVRVCYDAERGRHYTSGAVMKAMEEVLQGV